VQNSHYWLFFFQAEDGIRDFHVTGVQTCALPILFSRNHRRGSKAGCLRLLAICARRGKNMNFSVHPQGLCESSQIGPGTRIWARSEERRVGKESRRRWTREQ